MKIFYFILLSCFFIIVSCDEKKSTLSLNIKGEISFDTGFNPESKFSGAFFDKNTREEVIYFAEPVTQKIIKFFNTEGKILDSISLKNLSQVTPTINSLKVISRDTILFFNYTQIIVVNKTGNVRKQIDLQKLVENDKSDDIFEFNDAYGSGYEIDNSSIILNLNWVKNKRTKTDLSYEEFFLRNYDKPSIIKINNFLTDSISYTFSKQNHYRSFTEKPKIFSEGFNCKQINNRTFIMSNYTNFMLIYDKNKLKVIDKISIFSDFTAIGREPLNIDDSSFASKETFEKAKMAGAITNLFYNYKTKEYFVVVRHQIEKDFIYKEKERPFSIIKYDKNFNKISEVIINQNKLDYFGYKLIQTQSRIMILNNKNTDDKKISFTIFE